MFPRKEGRLIPSRTKLTSYTNVSPAGIIAATGTVSNSKLVPDDTFWTAEPWSVSSPPGKVPDGVE